MSTSEYQLLNKVLTDKKYNYITDNMLTENNFVQTINEYNYLESYYKEYNDVPDKTTFVDKFPNFKLFTVDESVMAIVDRLREEDLFRRSLAVFNKASEYISADANKGCEYLRSAIKKLEPNYRIATTGYSSSAKDRLEAWKERQKNSDDTYIRLPDEFKELQTDVCGFRRKSGADLWLLLAKSGTGKSQIMSCFVASCANQGYRTGLISPEMSTEDFSLRVDTYNGKFSNRSLEDGRMVVGYEKYLDELSTKDDKLFISDLDDFDGHITMQKIKIMCKSKDLQALFIDGLTYVQPEYYTKGMSDAERQGEVAQELLALSSTLKIPIITAIQARRRSGEKKDKSNSLSDSESIFGSYLVAQKATRVLSVNRSEDNKAITLYLSKNRYGEDNKKYIYLYDYDHLMFTFIPNLEDATEEEKEAKVEQNKGFTSIF